MHKALPVAVLLALLAPAAYAGDNGAPVAVPDAPTATQSPVTLTINPDGTAVWDGEPLAGVPELKNKLAHQTEHDPKLELELHFHSVDELRDSNRQTLLQVLELAAKFGYVHVQSTTDGALLTVIGPTTVEGTAK